MVNGNVDPMLSGIQKIIIYSTGALNRPFRNNVDIQKMMFLLSRAYPEKFSDYVFQQHKKGPYSESINESVAILGSSGYFYGSDFALSEKGYREYLNIRDHLVDYLKDSIDDFKALILQLSEDELLLFIYVNYPEYVYNSEVWDRLRENRLELSII